MLTDNPIFIVPTQQMRGKDMKKKSSAETVSEPRIERYHHVLWNA